MSGPNISLFYKNACGKKNMLGLFKDIRPEIPALDGLMTG